MQALDIVDRWPASRVSVALVGPGGIVGAKGDLEAPFALASVTKLLTAYAALVAVEEHTIGLDEAAGPPGATFAHLLADASGLGLRDRNRPRVSPGKRRVYSNAGFEVLGEEIGTRAAMSFEDYLQDGVLRPLQMTNTVLEGSPAWGGTSTVHDLVAFVGELFSPQLVDSSTLSTATDVAFAGLAGMLPGFGRFSPCDWGLGFEIKSTKFPHWTGTLNSPGTFGHFGRSGTFLWVDPVRELALVALTDREFGTWAKVAWPALADAVINEVSTRAAL